MFKISLRILPVTFFALVQLVHAQEKKFDLDRLSYPGFWTIKQFALVDVSLEGTAEKLGLKEKHLNEYLRLRFKNNFSGMQFKEPDTLFRILLNKEEAVKYGSINVRIWTVGDDFPVAFYIELKAGNLTDVDEYKRAMLGYGSRKNVPETVRNAITELVEDAAVDFFKTRGEL